MNNNHKILVLDSGGIPKEWISTRDAIIHHAKDQVAWELGEDGAKTFTGGTNRISGELSTLTTAPIIALRHDTAGAKRMRVVPSLNNMNLFRRDNWQCCYCGQQFHEHQLTRDHVIPVSRKGEDIWMNVVSSCKRCNNIKDDALLSDLYWDMHFKPYVPNHVEGLFYRNLNVTQSQIDYLTPFLKEHSRIWGFLEKIKQLEVAVDEFEEA